MAKSKKQMAMHQRVVQATKEQATARYEKHYHPSNPHHKKHILADSVLGVIVLALTVFSLWLLFFYQAAILKEQIQLQVIPSSYTVRSGDALSYQVKVTNNADSNLENTFLSIPEASGFILSMSSPLQSQEGIIPLGTIDPNESILVELSGIAVVDLREHLRLHAILHYDAGFTGTHQKFSSELIEVTGSALSVDWELPETIIANQPFPFSLRYGNVSEATRFDEVVIIPNFPPALEIIETTKEFDEELGAFTIGSVGSLEQGVIEGRLSVNTADLDTALIEASIYSAPFGKPLLQSESSKEIPVRFPNISIDFTADRQVASPGAAFTTTASITNREDFPIRDVSVRYKLNRALFSTSALPGGVNAEGYYTQSLSAFIAAEGVQSVSQSFTLRGSINPELAFGNSDPRVIIDANLFYTDAQGQEVFIPMDAIVLGLNTDLNVHAFARYYSAEGDQIGRGPLPPVVGETTKYWIFLELDNQLHAVEDLRVTAKLAEGVSFTGKSSVTTGEAIQVSQGSNQVSWQLDALPDYKTNFSNQRFGAAIEVAFTPTAEQVGKSVVLMREIEVQGRDSVTGLVVSDQAPLVTNNLLNDAFASDTGEVQL